MISPEFMFLTDSSFSGVIGLPGVMFNYVGKGFFVGAGPCCRSRSPKTAGAGELLPKINIGYRGGHINFTVYTITAFNGFFKYGLRRGHPRLQVLSLDGRTGDEGARASREGGGGRPPSGIGAVPSRIRIARNAARLVRVPPVDYNRQAG